MEFTFEIFSEIISTLLVDCPYDMYWYNKVVKGAASWGYHIGTAGSTAYVYNLTVYFTPVSAYQGTDPADTEENEDSAVDAGTSLVEAEMKDEGTDTEKEMTGVENTVLADTEDADQTSAAGGDLCDDHRCHGNGTKSRGRTDTGKAHSPAVGDLCRMWIGLEDGAFRKRESDTISGTGEASVGSHV